MLFNNKFDNLYNHATLTFYTVTMAQEHSKLLSQQEDEITTSNTTLHMILSVRYFLLHLLIIFLLWARKHHIQDFSHYKPLQATIALRLWRQSE